MWSARRRGKIGRSAMTCQQAHRVPLAVRPPKGILVLALFAAAACAPRGERAVRWMEEVNRRALADYEKGQHEAARDRLLEAVSVGEKAELDADPVMARTHLNLGVVYADGLKDRTSGVAHMSEALEIQPDIEVSPELATPPVKRAFGAARGELKTAQRTRARERRGRERDQGAEPRAEKAEKDRVSDPGQRPAPAPEPAPSKGTAAQPVPGGPTSEEEPDLPASLPEPLYCPVPDQAPPGNEILLRCATRPGLRVARVLLYFRPPGTEVFTSVPMPRSRKGWYTGVIPADATGGTLLQYYFEAQASNKKVASSNGHAESPNMLMLRAGAPADGRGAFSSENEDPMSISRDENPLAPHFRQGAEPKIRRRAPGALWVGLGLGSGYGWQPGRDLEFRNDQQVSMGFLGGGLLHATPEVGYQLNDRLAVSLQSRHQYIPEEGAGEGRAGGPRRSAHAVFARAHYFLGEGNIQLFGTGTVGGGQGFRLVIPPESGERLARNDTVRGGPVVLGPGAGFVYHFFRRLSWATELRLLLGFPDVALVGDLSTGLQVTF
jgi:hypothetical protein